MRLSGPRSVNIEDRRVAPVRPSAPDALVRGLPQNEAELALYRHHIAQMQALKAGRPPAATGGILGQGVTPGPGDPAGIEDARRQAVARAQAAREVFLKLSQRL